MEIRDTLLINVDINDEEPTVEIVTYHGSVRDVLNTFKGNDAVTIYNTLVQKHLVTENLEKLKTIKKEDLTPQNITINNSAEQTLILERHSFKTEQEAKIVLSQIRLYLVSFDKFTLSDFYELTDRPSNITNSEYVIDESEDLTIMQNDNGWYIYPLIFKSPSNKKVKETIEPLKPPYLVKTIIFDDLVEAETVLTQLKDMVKQYGLATVADYYDLVGEFSVWYDDQYCWRDLEIDIVLAKDDGGVAHGYLINLPLPEPVGERQLFINFLDEFNFTTEGDQT